MYAQIRAGVRVRAIVGGNTSEDPRVIEWFDKYTGAEITGLVVSDDYNESDLQIEGEPGAELASVAPGFVLSANEYQLVRILP